MRPRLVLVVEDNDDDQALTVRSIRKADEECSVVVARDGEAALITLGIDKRGEEGVLPDLILLDIKMPKRSGLEVLERIRADERTKDLQVVVFSSSDEASDVRRVGELGAAYRRKPVEYETYIQVVQSVIRESLSTEPSL